MVEKKYPHKLLQQAPETVRHRQRTARAFAAAIALSGLAIGFVACGDDDGGSDEDKAAVQATIDAVNQASIDADAETFLQYVTPNGLEEIFFTTEEQVRENPEETIGSESEADNFVATEITVEGDTAEAAGGFPGQPAGVLVSPLVIEFVKEGDVWKVDGQHVADADEPDGAQNVELTLNEFVIDFDEGELESGSPVLFEVENAGAQSHHLVLFKLDEGVVLEEVLEEEEPEGVEELGFAGDWAPDESSDVAFTADLEPGRYAFLCFLPDTREENPEEQQPHYLLGMVKEFTVD